MKNIKAIVHPKVLSSFTRPYVVANLFEFLLLNYIEYILKNVVTGHLMAVNGFRQHAPKHILYSSTKETRTGLQQPK